MSDVNAEHIPDDSERWAIFETNGDYSRDWIERVDDVAEIDKNAGREPWQDIDAAEAASIATGRPIGFALPAGVEHLCPYLLPFTYAEVSWIVVDTKVEPGARTPVLGAFPSEELAARYIETLPEYESGRYGLDPLDPKDQQ